MTLAMGTNTVRTNKDIQLFFPENWFCTSITHTDSVGPTKSSKNNKKQWLS